MNIIDAVDFPVIDKFNAIAGALIVLATYIFGEHWVLFLAFLVLNFTDYITGTFKGRVLKKVSSSAGLKGIIKKFSYWIMILISFGMSPVLNEIGETIGTDLSSLSPFIGWFTLATLMMNELRSVLENLVEAGIKVPPYLVNGLSVLSKVVDAQEKMFDGSLEINKVSDEKYHANLDKSIDELEHMNSVTLKIRTLGDDDE